MKIKTIITSCLRLAAISAVFVAPMAIGEMPAEKKVGAKGLSPSNNAPTPADAVVQEMAAAFKKNDSRTLTRLLPRAKGSTLEPWAAYFEIKARLSDADQSDIDRFAKRYPNTYVEDRLRADWLLLLGQRRDWTAFAANYPAYRMRDDKDIRCYVARDDAVLAETLWMSQKETNSGCGFVANALIDAGKMDATVAWRKAYKGQVPPQASWDKLVPAQKNWAWGFEGKALAQKLDLAALQSFANVTRPQDLSADMLDWWARAALRRKDWPLVVKVIDAMGAEGQREWGGWREVVVPSAAIGATSVSPPRFASAPRSGGTNDSESAKFPPNGGMSQSDRGEGASVSSAAMGVTSVSPPRFASAPRSGGTYSNLTPALPGLNRALYAIQNGLREGGVREWNYEVNLARGSMNDADRLAAAELACKAQVWDRCINTSERTKDIINWQQRYPMPYKEAILAAAKEQGVEAAFVFGLIRQESRFVADIQSHVGAAGLMQLMPPTARWTAKRIGLAGFTSDQVQDIDVNVRLGTGYLKYVLDEFGGNPALAAAAYNAGPHRVKTWKAAMAVDTGVTTPLDIAIWSENIPFLETRDYVKKVQANVDVYRQLLK